MAEPTLPPYFHFFNEIGILNQLSRALLEARLPGDLISPHFGVVNHLIRVRDGGTPLQIARAFQVPKTTMTHTLAGLEKHGLIEMRPNPDDKRSKQVWLTPKGRAFRDETVMALQEDMEGFMAEFPIEEVMALTPTLTRMREFLDAARDTKD